MSCAATLRRTGGSITLSIPKNIARIWPLMRDGSSSLCRRGANFVGDGGTAWSCRSGLQSVRNLRPAWHRDESLADEPVGREVL